MSVFTGSVQYGSRFLYKCKSLFVFICLRAFVIVFFIGAGEDEFVRVADDPCRFRNAHPLRQKLLCVPHPHGGDMLLEPRAVALLEDAVKIASLEAEYGGDSFNGDLLHIMVSHVAVHARERVCALAIVGERVGELVGEGAVNIGNLDISFDQRA